MISVIVDARGAEAPLPPLLAALTAGAVDGLVRDLTIVADAASPLIEALCEETGAEVALDGIAAAAGRARHERVLVLPADIRLKGGWIATISDHLARGGGDAMVQGEKVGGFFAPTPFGVLASRERVGGLAQADLKGLRRGLSSGAPRLG